MTSFDGVTIKGERGNDGTSFPTWNKPGVSVVKKIPGGDVNVIQIIGTGPARLGLAVKVTFAQLTSLYGKLGVTGSLVFSYETATAKLESIDTPVQIGTNDEYFTTLNFIRSSGVSTTPATAFLTEAGDILATEGGDAFVTE